jgi:uncharacterized protein (TIGR02246 family)
MSPKARRARVTPSTDEGMVRALYAQLMAGWNTHSSTIFAAQFNEAAYLVGFDGSQMNGRAEIETNLRQIFAGHPTAAYVWIIKDVQFLTPEVAILRAVVGMVPPGQSDLNPAVNAIQTLVAVKRNRQWRIALFQNTPAQFHGRPDLQQALTKELRELL